MALQPGSMISHYRLAEKIGEGGMGEVYRAQDTKLGRDVALKVLPDLFTSDAQRMARFAREAQVLASLNHPHLGSIYGLEDEGATKALVLELIEGETLGERIARGAIPVAEALGVARQIAEGLEAAHEKGIIHRDLKPANVKITPDGTVKVLDFGLAKALTEEAGSTPDMTRSPTLTGAATQAGIILGTAGYMAPEQARGYPTDRRSDIWAFGVVLYEMLTGIRLFDGGTVTDVLAAVVRAEPDFNKLPSDSPAALRRLLRRCLSKEPADRMRDFGDVRLEIREAMEGPEDSQAAGAESVPAVPRPFWPRALSWAASAVLIAGAAIGGYAIHTLFQEKQVVHASILPPEKSTFHLSMASPGVPAVSPDGKMIAFSARDKEGEVNLYVRQLSASDAYVLSGTQGAQYPFWSPDSRYVGFFTQTDGTLKKIAASGGPPVTLCEASNGKGGTWNREGIIVFSPSHDTGLWKVSASGGIPAPLTKLNRELGDSSHRHPFFLPDGRHFLYLARGRKLETGGVGAVLVRSLEDGKDGANDKFLLQTEAGMVYASGYILFLRDDVLMAQAFDSDELELVGEPYPVAEGVSLLAGASKGVFSASDGVLAYIGGIEQVGHRLIWLNREGVEIGKQEDVATYSEVMLSPDGTLAAVSLQDPAAGSSDIWIYDLKRDVRSRFTFGPENESRPVWSPDGKRVYFAQQLNGVEQIAMKPIGGRGKAELVYESDMGKYPRGISPDGRILTYIMNSPETNWDVWGLPLAGEKEPFPLVQSDFVDVDGTVSPDGRWLAYMSMESGKPEIYVTSFPDPGRKWQISTKGGDNPSWSATGGELYYQDLSGAVTSARLQSEADSIIVDAPVTLFERPVSNVFYRFAPAPDDQSFLVVDPIESQGTFPLTLVLNWDQQVGK